jgi:phosphotriesterase-related protein
LAKTGVWLSLDTFGWETSFRQRATIDMPNDAVRINHIIALVEAGYADQVLISSDLAIEHWERNKGGWGWPHIPVTVRELMSNKGLGEDLIDQILIDNPRRFLTMG